LLLQRRFMLVIPRRRINNHVNQNTFVIRTGDIALKIVSVGDHKDIVIVLGLLRLG